MKILIELSEEIMDIIARNGTNETVAEALWQAVKKGTLLPKGHGRIGDLDRLYYVFEKNVVSADAFKELFDHAPTIIEADKEK